MTTVEKLEKQLGQVLETAKGVQSQLQQIQKQGLMITQQGEIKAREFLHQVFDSGLTLLGQGMLTGRKAAEAFVAETHRKIDKLNLMDESLDSEEVTTELTESEREVTPLQSLNGKQKIKNPKFKGVKNKKQRAHLNNTSRSH